MHWRWRYLNSEISDLSAYCPRCDTELVAIVEKVLGHLEFASWGSRPRILHMHCETCCQDCYTSDSVSLYDLRAWLNARLTGSSERGSGDGALKALRKKVQEKGLRW